MTGDGKAIGHKWGIAWTGKWVWKLKDFIDVSFMKLFDPNQLFNDYSVKGVAEPREHNFLFEQEKADDMSKTAELRQAVEKYDPIQAAKVLHCSEEEEEFRER
mmetsp:Transcript_37400/g.27595  ORF Transcript_37400/g.27595 Transcript_37400/m.27595 type:complete len:103 (-) Transcript_37400:119-427(-)|eukprot:CAMPEP_0202955576 /NCGR_PEP_ID=MMETSP1396-20130829/124_1 /ASSEMBLY_ACC=CAM_ASM_000872 /TAXON_ID= /ORGANISM="Pseudokeronopsis sp., Strain Brazil" /LENGTH=102 /DNA_ID=CAMNT_0049672221 /DNA_START=1020 /DNA_END=1328 /DNA_ORIENTATION=-